MVSAVVVQDLEDCLYIEPVDAADAVKGACIDIITRTTHS
jgi:hypothetical protein